MKLLQNNFTLFTILGTLIWAMPGLVMYLGLIIVIVTSALAITAGVDYIGRSFIS